MFTLYVGSGLHHKISAFAVRHVLLDTLSKDSHMQLVQSHCIYESLAVGETVIHSCSRSRQLCLQLASCTRLNTRTASTRIAEPSLHDGSAPVATLPTIVRRLGKVPGLFSTYLAYLCLSQSTILLHYCDIQIQISAKNQRSALIGHEYSYRRGSAQAAGQ